MRTKWSGTVSQDAVLIKLRRRLKLILSSWAVHKKEKKGVYEKEGKRKERRKKKQAKNEPTHNSALSKGRNNATSYENAKPREKRWARPNLGFSCVVFAGKYTAQSPPPPPPPQRKKNSLKLPPLPLTLKTTNTTTFSLFSVFQHWQCLSSRHPLFLFVVMYVYIVPWSVFSSLLSSVLGGYRLVTKQTKKQNTVRNSPTSSS